MTWYTTWQTGTGPAYAEHATEADAERHAAEIARGGGHVTVYEVDDEPQTPPRATETGLGAPQGSEWAAGATGDLKGAQNDSAVIREGIA